MATPLNAAGLNSFSSQFGDAADTLKNQLGVLQSHASDFAGYIKSSGAGTATQASLQNALDKGNKLQAVTMQISQALGDAGAKTGSQDTHAQSQIQSAAGRLGPH